MSRKKQPSVRLIDIDAVRAKTREVAKPQRLTCEGCIGLRLHPRPMCQLEASPNFRQVRDTYHERCGAYAHLFKAMEAVTTKPPVAAVKTAPRVVRRRTYTTGDVARRLM